MLVDIVQTMESPKRVIPSTVWFECINRGCRDLPDSLYFSSNFGSGILLSSLSNRKPCNAGTRGLIVDQRQLPNQMIECTPQILESIARDDRNSYGDIGGPSQVPLILPRMTVVVEANLIGVAVEKILDNNFKVIDVLFGPISFGSN